MIKNILIICLTFLILISCRDNKEKALELMKSALQKSDNSDFTGALDDYNKSIDYDSTNAKVWYLRGCIKISLSKFNESIYDFEKAVKLNEKYTDAYFNLGYVYDIMGNKDKSCENYFTAFRLGRPNIAEKLRDCKEIQ